MTTASSSSFAVSIALDCGWSLQSFRRFFSAQSFSARRESGCGRPTTTVFGRMTNPIAAFSVSMPVFCE
jgi:hypothetical protein